MTVTHSFNGPRVVAWESTVACNLACVHCRASAQTAPEPDELTTEQVSRLIDQLVELGSPIFIISGGEPLMRPDIFDIPADGTQRGLRMAISPNGTLIAPEVVRRLKEAGIRRVSVSIDGSTDERHDAVRGTPGAFEAAIAGLAACQEGRLDFQLNTTVMHQTGVYDWLNLPALRVFKLKAHFKLPESNAVQQVDQSSNPVRPARTSTPADIPFVRAFQRDLVIASRPFAEAAGRLNLSEQDLLDRARELAEAGIMRRFGAVLRHRRVGYTANGMACWVVPEAQMETVGLRCATFPEVSHCYQRPAYPPRWPYTLFAMIHGQMRDEVESIVDGVVRETGIGEYRVLYSTQEFKKERVRYFEEEDA